VTPSGDVTLPEAGGVALLPMGLIGLGVAALGAGFGLRRRQRGKGSA
jgi:LPXTG-motif cell wall-anchored protein